jgi:hypothetical protein
MKEEEFLALEFEEFTKGTKKDSGISCQFFYCSYASGGSRVK